MTQSKVFTVFGATGQQGGAVVRYILQHLRFSQVYRLRAVTRDASKSAARDLVELGVEVVEADLNNPESVKAAMRSAHTVFAVTNHWDPQVDTSISRAQVEIAQGKTLADAAVANKVELYIWSSLPRIGKPHFDSKAEVEEYVRSLPLTSVYFMAGFYMQNFLVLLKPTRQSDGTYLMTKPYPGASGSTVLPLIDIRDSGKYIAPFLEDPNKYKGERLFAATAGYRLDDICRVWSDVTGTKVVFDEKGDILAANKLSEAQREGLTKSDGRGRAEIGYYGTGGEDGARWTVEQVEGVGERLATWDEFVGANEPWFE
ncbi:hypothetical protein LTR10_022748 [Elasticomyces elasticus]|uniref:NmrA-like domain-containing protein n=1 Tax=Exophiala sideris TaxID=1016849 RepID=A0ABR0JAF3_9EURO|nr:hypothetical protein LTR10_022748 [Elasticomyces elasticus]KAK5026136.1 hypothetical protein LTS07_007661 [Exophiala sideris]KAK5032390.1 hypothetical protein LTR13_007213 [Exophiala sideris]KAK5059546.1 hypothetical protein LTR69_006135 [Exophiala sideris]KAK5186708.1 hypothetical protein LTR44_000714 [Eurotiomycetes sp. CCFEE 6388]